MPTPRIFSMAIFAACCTGLATPLMAQEFCAGTGTAGQWIGGDQAASDITTADNYREQMALVMGGNNHVALFTLSAPTDIRIEAAGRGAGDPVIDILDAKGLVVLSDDDSGGNAASRVESTLGAGTYCVATRSFDGGPMTAFVRVGRLEHDPLTEGLAGMTDGADLGSCAEAQPIGPLGTTVSASANAVPFWSFTLETPTAISITATNSDADPLIILYDATQTYITENDDADGLNSRIDMASPLAAGTYCLNVSALSDPDLPISVTVLPYDPAAAMMAGFNDGTVAPPLDGTVPVTALGPLTSRLRQDVTASQRTTWFTFDMPETGLVLLEAIGGSQADPTLVVFDDVGRQLGFNDDGPNGNTDSLLALPLPRGTYIIGVKLFGGDSGLIRLVGQRYIPAE